MAELCVKILQFISAGELRLAFPLSDELRGVRSRLSDLLATRLEAIKGFEPATSFEFRQLEQIKLGIGIIAKYDQFHEQWIEAIVEPNEEDLCKASVEEWHIVMEKRLPQGWNREKDLLVVFGDVTESLHIAITERIQHRVLVCLPKKFNENEVSGVEKKFGQEEGDANHWSFNEKYATVSSLPDLKRSFPLEDPPKLISEILGCNSGTVDELKPFREELRTLYLIATVSSNTTKVFGPRWLNQGLGNLVAIAKSQPLADLKGLFKGMPMILISPGPSLDKNIKELKRAVGKAILVAPAQTIRRLHREGIYPDFVVVIDPQDLTSDPLAFLDHSLIMPHQALIVGATCHPNVFNLPFKRRYVFGSARNSSWITELFDDTHTNTAGTSVSVAATNIGVEWGCSPIILVGQDLAYIDGVQYAGNNAAKQKDDAHFELEGYNGGKVKTPYGYKVAHYEFQLIAERVSNFVDPLRLINATEGGARIDGFTQIPLQTVIDESLSDSPELIKRFNFAIDASLNYDYKKRALTGRQTIQFLENRINSLRSGALTCKQVCMRVKRNATERNILRLDKEERKMRRLLKSLGFLELLVQEEINQITTELSTQSSFASNVELSLKLYDLILRACDLVNESLSGIVKGNVDLLGTASTNRIEAD